MTRCQKAFGNYQHYWVKKGGDCGPVGSDKSWDREMLLVCCRCGKKLYIDSVIRRMSHDEFILILLGR